MRSPSTSFTDSKKHYEILDGLRGVAAIMVVIFHIFETFTGGDHAKQIINHGYLAVDFFFLLSGYVIGYAYDDRWQKMTLGSFFKRRLIRLHPMIVVAMIFGAILFYFQDCAFFPNISKTSVGMLLLITLIGCTLLPVPLSMDIRGWTEMHPLDGPAWSLFFEYIANILYAFIIRRFSKTLLAIFVFIAGVALIHLTVTGGQGDVIGGWSLEPAQLRIGFTRLCYPFFAGLLLSRVTRPGQFNNAFLWCSILLVAMLAIPRVGDKDHLWMNGLYDSLTIILIFPLIVYLGASGEIKGKAAGKICKFLGDISYPVYIIHYPIIYTYMAWVAKNEAFLTAGTAAALRAHLLAGATVVISAIVLAYALLKWYDEPVRKWLTRKWLPDSK